MSVLRWGSVTDVGMTRETNQDALLVAEPLFAVADGMGGHQGGEVASATALEVLESTFAGHTRKEDLLEAVRRANAKVWDKAQLDDSLHGMGTTLTAIARVTDDDTHEESIAVINVGDSRTYLMRDDDLRQMTADHSFVEEMVRAGELSADEAESHPKRNILTRALGVEPTVEVDVETVRPQNGDRLLLCSDGLVRELTDDQISAVLRRLKDPEEAAKELVAQAKSHGGHDNITVVIVDVEKDDEPIELNIPGRQRQPRNKKTKLKAVNTKQPGSITLRVILFFCVFIALLAVAAGSVVWYARASYYVGLEGQQLVIYRGRPDAVLWFKPTVTERTNVMTSDVPTSALPRLQEGATQSSIENARQYILNLTNEQKAAQQIAQAPTATSPNP